MRRARWRTWAWRTLAAGAVALGSCLAAAVHLRPEPTDKRPVDGICAELLTKAGPATADDRLGKLRLVAVAPDVVGLGDPICIIVAGVTSERVVGAAAETRAQRQEALEDAEAKRVEATTPALLATAQKLVETTTKELEAAELEEEQGLPMIGLTLYLDGKKSPLVPEANQTPDPQPLLFDLEATSNAGDENAGFWRRLVADVNSQSIRAADADWGSFKVSVGLSPATATGTTPATDARGTERQAVELYVYSLPPLVLGTIGRVAQVVGIGGRRNLRVPRSTDRRLLPPRRSRHGGTYRALAVRATGRR